MSLSTDTPVEVRVPDERERRSGSRAASGIVFAYLLATLPLVLNAGASGMASFSWPVVIVMHVAALAVSAWAWRHRPRDPREPVGGRRVLDVVADWMPLLLVPFLYAELPTLMLGLGGSSATGPVYHDALVQRREEALFGGQPARTLAGAFPHRWLSELLHAGYLSYYAIIYGPPLVLYVSNRRAQFSACLTAVMLAFTSCFLVFALWPVAGPRYLWPAPDGVPDGPIRHAVLAILQGGSSRGTAFPSSHAAVSVAQSVALWRVGARRLSSATTVITALLVIGAVYGGFHYAIDVSVGVVLGAALAQASDGLRRRVEGSLT